MCKGRFKLVELILCFFLSIISLVVQAQKKYTIDTPKAITFYESGASQYRLKNYMEAEELFLKAIKAEPLFLEAYIVTAELYWDQKRYEEAVQKYNEGLSIDSTFYINGFYNKGVLEMKIGEYNEVKSSFTTFLNLAPKGEKKVSNAKRAIKQAEFAIGQKEKPVDFNPVKLSSNINTTDDEYWPSLSADAQTFIFTRLVGSGGGLSVQEDFYISSNDTGGWKMARNAGAPLNTPDNEGAQSISANGKFMVYTVCNRKGVIGRCDLYYSRRIGDKWSVPENMGRPVNTEYKETQPSLSSDGRTIYFVSNRPGGYGKHDIWMSKQGIDGKWEEPVNLGDSVNTKGFESSPFIHHDNKTLYFSSNYHMGMGGFDIFYSRKNDEGNWNTPKNLGYPINTHRDEIGLIITAKGDMAYYSSNIEEQTGRDIYRFVLYKEARPAEVSYLKGKVYNSRNRQALKASFELYDLNTGQLINRSFSDYRNGEFLICIPTNRNYMLNVSKEGFLFYSENFSLEGVHHIEEPYFKDIPLIEIMVGKTIVLRNIFFDTDKYELKPESGPELNKLVDLLNQNPELIVEISGHTDNQGSEQHNLILSENRAKAVVDYLVSRNIDKSRLNSKGYGFSKPIDVNTTTEGRANNRRTELKILEENQ